MGKVYFKRSRFEVRADQESSSGHNTVKKTYQVGNWVFKDKSRLEIDFGEFSVNGLLKPQD